MLEMGGQNQILDIYHRRNQQDFLVDWTWSMRKCKELRMTLSFCLFVS